MSGDPRGLVIATPRTLLALPGAAAARRLLEFHLENRAHLEKWEPPRSIEFYSEGFWAERLENNRREAAEDRSLRLTIFDVAHGLEGPVLGSVAIHGIVRGPFQSCVIGYNIAAAVEGRGLARETVAAALDHVWDALRLHRVEASYAPTNERSGRLLRRLGFAVEGYSRDYLFDGRGWIDQVRTAILNPRFPAGWRLG